MVPVRKYKSELKRRVVPKRHGYLELALRPVSWVQHVSCSVFRNTFFRTRSFALLVALRHQGWVGELTMSVEDMPDERLVRYYENVRQQVEADRAGNHKFMMNPTVQQYADQLQSEMIKRGLEHSPIEWPQEMARKHRQVVDKDGQQESNVVATRKSPMIGVQMHE